MCMSPLSYTALANCLTLEAVGLRVTVCDSGGWGEGLATCGVIHKKIVIKIWYVVVVGWSKKNK